jgi:hypothetical protein
MTMVLSLARYGIGSRLFDEDHVLSEGSRAIAYSADTLAQPGIARESLMRYSPGA